MIDVSPSDLEIVTHILRRHVPDREVVAFGSRAKWTAKQNSDLDVAVLGDKPLAASTMAALKDDFDKSSVPFSVDVVDWATTKDSFREVIRRDSVLLKAAEEPKGQTGWREATIGEVAEIFDGPHATPEKTDEGPIFLGISDLTNGRLDLSGVEHLSEHNYQRWTRRVEPTAGDVVFSYETRLGEAARIPPGLRCCLGRRMGLLRAKPNHVDPRFLLYAFLGPEFQATIRSRTIHGSTVDRIPLVELAEFPIRIPAELGEQRAIAAILGTLDDKIELNRRMSETLEAMARAHFKSWFVDFDPVRAKAQGCDASAPNPVSDLFPGSFEESEMGEIPKGWKPIALTEVASLNPESWSRATVPSTIDYVDLSNTKRGRIEAIAHYEGRDAPSRAQRVLRPGDTIVGTVRPGNGSYALVRDEGLTGSTGFAVLRPRDPITVEFTYLAATSRENIDTLSHLADGGAYPAVRSEVVGATQVAWPGPTIVAEFSRLSSPLLVRMAHNERQSATLSDLRDALLPKLVSGELRVKDAERFAGSST
ncbi:MAG TPA: restriction endonuclease subunit S [Vicinamibacterales bacterium]|nr:restriction endonuclease subunit S [Vicinamibacterales bacterium]